MIKTCPLCKKLYFEKVITNWLDASIMASDLTIGMVQAMNGTLDNSKCPICKLPKVKSVETK